MSVTPATWIAARTREDHHDELVRFARWLLETHAASPIGCTDPLECGGACSRPHPLDDEDADAIVGDWMTKEHGS